MIIGMNKTDKIVEHVQVMVRIWLTLQDIIVKKKWLFVETCVVTNSTWNAGMKW